VKATLLAGTMSGRVGQRWEVSGLNRQGCACAPRQVVDAEAEELMERMEELGTIARSGAPASRLPSGDGSARSGGGRADLWRSSRYATEENEVGRA
jgi:hypothetical protein